MQKLDETFRSRCGEVANQLPDELFTDFGGVAFGAKLRVAHAAMSYRVAMGSVDHAKHVAALDEIVERARTIAENVEALAVIFDRTDSVDDVITLGFVMDGLRNAGVGRNDLAEGFRRHAVDFAAFKTAVAKVRKQATAHQPKRGPKKEAKLNWLFFVARLACIWEVLGDRKVTAPDRENYSPTPFTNWAGQIIRALSGEGQLLCDRSTMSVGSDFMTDMNMRLRWKDWPREAKVAYADGVLLGIDKRISGIAERLQLAN